MNQLIRNAAGNRDGPLIFHMRDGSPHVTGPPGGTVPPEELSGATGPPPTKDPPMEWLVRKKLKNRESLYKTGKTNLNASKEVSYKRKI